MGLDIRQEMDVVAERVIAIIAEQAMLEPEDITQDSQLAELGIDSLGVVECIFGIEEAFGITVPFNANTPDQPGFDISSVGAIIAEVEKLVARRAA
ncbi:acyl carrier protein [Natronohydrobacter thiooxidans]|uniref:acyl carrier protein n=1 Tax=Natronohydrobacter thiooxidans TaxID=87172 RepID=UPI000A9AAE32|nr:acyl carrier protein [Natronohydrobacter thiooxidans]